MEASVPFFAVKYHRRRRTSNRQGTTLSPNAIVSDIAVESGGNKELDHLHQAEALLTTSMQQRSSQSPGEIGRSLLLPPLFQVPRRPRSVRSKRQISRAPDVGSGRNSLAVGIGGNKESANQHQDEALLSAPMEQRSCQAPEEIGASEGCRVESHVTTLRPSRKRRPTKRSAYEKGSEICIPRSHCRGQSRIGLKSNNTEKKKLDTSSFDKLLENLLVEFSEEKRDSFICLDSLWFSLYSNNKGNKSNVLKWIKKKEIFTKKYVIIPIVMWGHWSLLILCHFGESAQSKFRTPCMLLLDSLKEVNPKRLEPEIRRFILDICTMEQRPLDKKQVKKIPLLVPKVPQQRDDKECGNFVLYYINLFIESAPDNFSISEGYPYFMTENWFDHEGVESFYERLGSLINTIDSDQDLSNVSDSDAPDELIEL